MLTVEFHCHTRFSKDSLVHPDALVKTCRRKGIDRVVITDHNEIDGALEAQHIDPGCVILGEEVMTSKGELLVAFIQKRVPPGLAPLEAITQLRQQGAFISVSHPFDRNRSGSWQTEDLLEILPHIDAVETFNSRCLLSDFNRQAQEFAAQHNLPGTVGSDAHTLRELGRAVLILPEFHDANSLRAALTKAQTKTRLSSPFIHFTSRWAVWKKMTWR
jgi:predicted metal-dependent phosphoesterase TrpH